MHVVIVDPRISMNVEEPLRHMPPPTQSQQVVPTALPLQPQGLKGDGETPRRAPRRAAKGRHRYRVFEHVRLKQSGRLANHP